LTGETQDEVGSTVTGASGGTTDGVAGEAAIEVHKTQFTVVARIEGLDDVVNIFGADFQVAGRASR
jgi:hypothetical protein